MASKKIASVLIATTLLASAAVVSTPAMAHDRGGNGVAIAAGIIGAVAIGSLIANSQPAPVYQAPLQQVYYEAPQPVYYQPPQQVVYEQPRYYAPPPPRPVRYVERTEVRTYRYDDRPDYYSYYGR